MGKETDISWCDSTLNGIMGCRGCELWTSKTKICYAGNLVERYAGQKGWPEKFEEPVIFSERMQKGINWKDLRGVARPDKPWIPAAMPRMIFLNDMGDTFTEGLPLNWLLPYIEDMEKSPHIWQILTKRLRRAKAFFDLLGYVPDNFWLGTTITDQRTADARLPYLVLNQAKTKFVSYEPMLGRVDLSPYLPSISWVILGGQSGQNMVEMSIADLEYSVGQCKDAGVKVFVKQDSAPSPGKQGRIPDELWIHEFPDVEVPAVSQELRLFDE